MHDCVRRQLRKNSSYYEVSVFYNAAWLFSFQPLLVATSIYYQSESQIDIVIAYKDSKWAYYSLVTHCWALEIE